MEESGRGHLGGSGGRGQARMWKEVEEVIYAVVVEEVRPGRGESGRGSLDGSGRNGSGQDKWK